MTDGPGSGRRRRPPAIRLAQFRVLLAVLAVGVVCWPAVARAKWSRPFQVAAPQTLDVLAPRLALASDGSAAATFGLHDVDIPGSAHAWLTLRTSRGAVSAARPVPAAQQILDLAYHGRSLELLTGSSPAGETCCSGVQAIAVGPGGATARPRTLVGGLSGATLGRLLTLAGGQMLAAVATERGVWVAQSARGTRFGGQHRLTGAGSMVQALAAVALGGGTPVVAWAAASEPAGAADPRTITGATGTRRSAPHRARTILTVARGHRIDEIGLAPRGAQATIAWIESWYDRRGVYHSVVDAIDLTAHAPARLLSPANRLASRLQFAGDGAGDQVAAWESCTAQGACDTDAAERRRQGVFGAASPLGPVDPAQPPALSVGPGGEAVVGWICGGDPMAAVQPAPGAEFGRGSVLSRAGYALDIAVAAGDRRRMLAAWSQGTLNPSVVAVAGS